MQIDLQKKSTSFSSTRSANEHDTAGRTADIDFFVTALSAGNTSTTGPNQAQLANILTMASEQLDLSKKRMAKSMRALSTGKDEKAKGDYPLMISNALLTTQVLVKSCGSVIQCVEKISNLQ
ncbi:hypothetical protein [Pseudomonas tolaasii]|nr:hypothetical protein [Pseudomonas tolaasii]PKA75373.1 hypothetical protein ATI14_2265 [Pseudomonas tolaasii NCPPB 2192]WLH52714.1 hypothetical protein PSH62_03710 [Pseudomonas tolaasii]